MATIAAALAESYTRNSDLHRRSEYAASLGTFTNLTSAISVTNNDSHSVSRITHSATEETTFHVVRTDCWSPRPRKRRPRGLAVVHVTEARTD